MTNVRVTGIFTYPVKSCAGISHDSMHLIARGFAFDRQWMIVRDDDTRRGLFVTQREYPRLALIQPMITTDRLVICAPGMPDISMTLTQTKSNMYAVRVWRDGVSAIDEGNEIAAWISTFIGATLRLVRFDDHAVRALSMQFTDEPGQTGFADAYPLLIASQESLSDLNERLIARGSSPVPMTRFRPNIVVQGLARPFDEDDWKWIAINGVRCEVAKPCARCAVTTVDPATGTIPERAEPLATLETFRRGIGRVSGVLFAQNVIHRGLGSMRVGDLVEITERI